MTISYVKVENYRNIDGIEVTFNSECNYIIGENNIGKSNFLSLLTTICSGKGFDEKDFADPEKPIEVEVNIKLLPYEQGFFGDNFSPEDASLLKIRYHQTIRETYPTIVSANSNESIPSKQLRKLNFLKYETKSVLFEDLLYTNSDGKKLLPLILSIDEPEVHLHPYLQRSLIGYFKRILCNEDAEFMDLLKTLFNVDGISGQLIIVTHSTDILIGDYRNLIRFYKKQEKTSAISGYIIGIIIIFVIAVGAPLLINGLNAWVGADAGAEGASIAAAMLKA